ncbi:MAG: hypothetical protein ACLQU1_08215 [Bryobacteraceae bacterium]
MRQRSLIVSTGLLLTFLAIGAVGAERGAFIGPLNKVATIASTVPLNGDQNPYGVAVVPRTTGQLVAGHVLVSNFNNHGPNGGEQGTGTTIVDVAPNGHVELFAEIHSGALPGPCPGGVGLTTALVVLQSGWVIVGSLPTADGTSATAQAGCLIVLNPLGKVVETLSGGSIDGPWDMTALDLGGAAVLFVANVLNGTVAAQGSVVDDGTVVRIVLATPFADSGFGGMPREVQRTVIASGFGERTDPAALVIGPTGVGLGFDGSLYVADTLGNRITRIANALFLNTSAGAGAVVSAGGLLNGPLGLAIAPNGDVLTTNGGDGNLVETTPGGVQVAVQQADTTGIGGGTLFGLAVVPGSPGIYFVNDGNNTLNLLH